MSSFGFVYMKGKFLMINFFNKILLCYKLIYSILYTINYYIIKSIYKVENFLIDIRGNQYWLKNYS